MNEKKGEMEGVRETERTVKRLLTWITVHVYQLATDSLFPIYPNIALCDVHVHVCAHVSKDLCVSE